MQRTTIFRSSTPRRAAMVLPFFFGLAIAVSAQAAAPSSYTVKVGDTLWGIARTQLGNPYRWQELYRWNQGVIADPQQITPGTVLKLAAAEPAAAKPAVVTPAAPPPPPPQAPALIVMAEPDTLPAVTQDQGEGDPATALFRRHRVASAQNAFRAYRESRFHPLRPGEVITGGFLTEGEDLPFGSLLGPLTPDHASSGQVRAAVQPWSRVALVPPSGATYAAGDSLLVVDRREGPTGFGEIVVPTGLVRVVSQDPMQALGDVIAVFGTMREGQSVLPIPAFKDPGAVELQPVPNGVEGHVLVARDPREVRLPNQFLFLDIGRRDGVALGDLFEARRTPGAQRRSSALAIDELMATLLVVQVRERSATVKVVKVISPSLPPGTRVRQVAKLPG